MTKPRDPETPPTRPRARVPLAMAVASLPALASLLTLGCQSDRAATSATRPSSMPREPAAEAAQKPAAPPPAPAAPKPYAAPPSAVWRFDDVEPGPLPAAWRTPMGDWKVEAREDAPSNRVVAQTASSASPAFNVALDGTQRYADVDLSVRLRVRGGRIDQGGGVMWRAQDEKNYYVARYNPLEHNYRAYKVEDGRRTQLASANVELGHDGWHVIRVEVKGTHAACFLDGKKQFDVEDDAFQRPGLVGLWTKADARTQFDDLVAVELSKKPPPAQVAPANGHTFRSD